MWELKRTLRKMKPHVRWCYQPMTTTQRGILTIKVNHWTYLESYSNVQAFHSTLGLLVASHFHESEGFLFWAHPGSHQRSLKLSIFCNSWLWDQWGSTTKVLLNIKCVFAKQRNLKPHLLRFMLCWSHKQGAWDQRGVFHVYGIENQSWLTIRF